MAKKLPLSLRIIKWLIYPFWWPLMLFPRFKALSIAPKVDNLYQKGDFDKANELRQEWIEKLPFKFTASLWRSQGDYLLYEQNEYAESLEAYRKSIAALNLSPSQYGVVDPLRLYYGAAVASVMVDSMDEAESYFNEFLPVYNHFSQNPKTQKYTMRYSAGLTWLRNHIYSDGTRKHLKLMPKPTEHSGHKEVFS